jgi:hypothetical protein
MIGDFGQNKNRSSVCELHLEFEEKDYYDTVANFLPISENFILIPIHQLPENCISV